MEKLKLSEIAKACNGSFSQELDITGVAIDTRKIQQGDLFICIKGERFDAHQFAKTAIENGASAVMIHNDIDFDCPYVKVEDTSKALLDLSGYYRSKFNIPLVALTGSVGKTSTKEFTYLVVNSQFNAIKTLGNLNNEIGLPQMLFRLDSSVEVAVIEMGMNHFGEIHKLTTAAKPNVALITNIGVSHIENLGSREGILKAKLEILDGLEKGAPLILNGDNDLLSTVSDDEHKLYFYGIDNARCDFKAENICVDNSSTTFDIIYFEKKQSVTIPTIGIHNVYNALAAFTVGFVLGIDGAKCAEALSKYQPEGMRQKSVRIGGITVIEDCYNASPDSMKAALSTLANTDGSRKIAVLSDMLELGNYSKQAHEQVGKMVFENKIDLLFAFGEESKYMTDRAKALGMEKVYYFSNKDDMTKALLDEIRTGDTLIFKASRGMKLEDVIRKVYEKWGESK